MSRLDGLTEEERASFESAGANNYWVNSKTGEKTLEHPGKRYFNRDRKILRKSSES